MAFFSDAIGALVVVLTVKFFHGYCRNVEDQIGGLACGINETFLDTVETILLICYMALILKFVIYTIAMFSRSFMSQDIAE